MYYRYTMNIKKKSFLMYIFLTWMSLIIALISLKTCICIAGICMEGSMSQNFELWLRFCFMVCRRRNFGEKKKSQKLPVFYHKIKTRTSTKDLRHASLDKNVVYVYSTFYT